MTTNTNILDGRATMTEHEMYMQIADYMRYQYPKAIYRFDLAADLKLSIGQAAKHKRLQGRRGYPDLFIAEPKFMEVETWADIKGYEGLYKISDHGRVKRVDNGEHFIKIQENIKNKYSYAHLSKDGKVKAFRVHRLVAEHFIDNPNNYSQVNHIDGDKSNNMYSNLEWVTASDNQLHRYHVLKKTNGGKPKRRVKCIETGKIYDSIAEATRSTGILHIRQVVAKKRKTAGGFRWLGL